MIRTVSSNVLDEVLEPFADCFTFDVAERVANLCASPKAQTRLEELADKANEGVLSAEESAEYDTYRDAFHFITILQAKARARLQR